MGNFVLGVKPGNKLDRSTGMIIGPTHVILDVH